MKRKDAKQHLSSVAPLQARHANEDKRTPEPKITATKTTYDNLFIRLMDSNTRLIGQPDVTPY